MSNATDNTTDSLLIMASSCKQHSPQRMLREKFMVPFGYILFDFFMPHHQSSITLLFFLFLFKLLNIFKQYAKMV